MSAFDPKMIPVWAAIAFVFGSLFGSFFNVVIGRVPRRFSIVLPGSHCPTCGTPIRWFDNIPLVSQIALGKRCRVCGAEISWRYFTVELLTAVIFCLIFLRFGYSGATVVYIGFASLLIIATFTDIDHWIIPESVSWGGLIAGLLIAFAGPWMGAGHIPTESWPHWGGAWYRGIANATLGVAVGWGILWSIAFVGRIAFRREAMGGGDIVLVAMFGAFLGWQGAVASLVLACLIGVVIAGTMLSVGKVRERARGGPLPPIEPVIPPDIDPTTSKGFRRAVEHLDLHRRERRVSSHLPFGPYLCLGALLLLLAWGPVMGVLHRLYVAPILEVLASR